ncbi:SDR family oxidoreductase [Nocardia sp. PE-7]|uniref:SDR family NAD(P)-dependent oxidoreductase n=2 Tax=Nocardia TaxID=1817 RepID=UPI00265A9A30|nr:SDR family oxidoreductase [Nocardia sp. PE-7]WKG11761.1 SDR family oxidoreductase [Nocardia sp. PE-7]
MGRIRIVARRSGRTPDTERKPMTVGNLHGKVALVTGANSGIGEAAAKILAARGASVVLAARRIDQLDRVCAEIAELGGKAVSVTTDVTVDSDLENAVATAVDQFGGLDIAFNNAGSLGTMGLVAEQNPSTWTADVNTVLTSTFLSMRHEIIAMQRRGGGVIINNASQLGLVGFGAGISAYVAGKHGVIGLTKAAALEYATQDIRINAVAFASVDTPMYRSSVGADEDTATMFRSLHPLGRIATAEEAASSVAYLATEEAGFFTGSVLVMDGGWTAQ